MKCLIRYMLAHFCSLLFVMPFGWCCWLPQSRADDEAEQSSECCCCSPKTVPAPPDRSKEKLPIDISCCCTPLPATRPIAPEGSVKPSVQLLPFVMIGPAVEAGMFSGGYWIRNPFLEGR